MSSTVVRDSVVGDAWIKQTAEAVPVQRIVDQKTGATSGDILTGPVRLCFPELFTLPQPTATMQNPKYGASLLFTPYADFSIFYEEYYRVCAAEFASRYDAQSGTYSGLHSPFRDQSEKLRLGGFTPGLVFMSCTSKFKPPVVDRFGNPVVDASKVYAGVWAICALNAYAYKDPRKSGVGFGLQSVMLIGDDTPLAGGAPDTNAQYGAVRGAIAPPSISAGAVNHMASGGASAQGHAPGAGAAVAPPPGGTYAGPSGGMTTPPGRPGGGMAPPGRPGAAPGYAMPGAPAPNTRGPVPQGFASWAEYDDIMG